MTHFPKDPRCPVCNNCKIQKKPRRRKKQRRATFADWKEPKEFADLVTADHMIIAEHKVSNQSKNEDRYAIVIQDWATKWINAVPVLKRSVVFTVPV